MKRKVEKEKNQIPDFNSSGLPCFGSLRLRGSGSGQALLAVMTSLATEAPGLAEEQLLPLAAKAKLGTGRRNLPNLLPSWFFLGCSLFLLEEERRRGALVKKRDKEGSVHQGLSLSLSPPPIAIAHVPRMKTGRTDLEYENLRRCAGMKAHRRMVLP